MGRASLGRPDAVRVPDPGRRTGWTVVVDDPQQARGLSRGVRRLRSGAHRALRQTRGGAAAEESGHRAQPSEGRVGDYQRARLPGFSGTAWQLREAPVDVRRRQADPEWLDAAQAGAGDI